MQKQTVIFSLQDFTTVLAREACQRLGISEAKKVTAEVTMLGDVTSDNGLVVHSVQLTISDVVAKESSG